MLLDYTVQSGMEKLPSGEEVKTLLFQKENVHIRFLPVRIDFDYVYANANCTSEKALESAYQFSGCLVKYFIKCRPTGSRL